MLRARSYSITERAKILECGGYEFRGREVAGTGTIYSHTVIRHPVHPDLSDRVPYTVVLVSLDELPAVRITGNLLEVAPEDARVGLAVRAVWEEYATEALQ